MDQLVASLLRVGVGGQATRQVELPDLGGVKESVVPIARSQVTPRDCPRGDKRTVCLSTVAPDDATEAQLGRPCHGIVSAAARLLLGDAVELQSEASSALAVDICGTPPVCKRV